MTPGHFLDLPMSAYLAGDAVSAGILKAVVDDCPHAGWFRSWLNPQRPPLESNNAADIGSIAHKLLLDGNINGVCVIDPLDHPAEKTGATPTGWTNKSIRAARDDALAAGKIPVLSGNMDEIEAMFDAAWSFISSLKETEPAIWEAFQEGGGQSESTLVWQDGKTLCRARPDRISMDRRLIVDYKTTAGSAHPDAWGRSQMIKLGFYQSACFYLRGVQCHFDELADYVFLTQSQEAPYRCSLVGLDPHAITLGMSKVETSLRIWERCAEAGHWPAYPSRVAYPSIPAFVDAEWTERLEQETQANGLPES